MWIKLKKELHLKLKQGKYLERLTPEAMKLLRSTEYKITKDKNDENVPNPEITEVVLFHINIVNKDYQQFAPNKPFGQLLEISPKNHIFLKIFNSEFQVIEVWFTDQISNRGIWFSNVQFCLYWVF